MLMRFLELIKLQLMAYRFIIFSSFQTPFHTRAILISSNLPKSCLFKFSDKNYGGMLQRRMLILDDYFIILVNSMSDL